MTTPPVPVELTLAFPTPGPLLGSAYLDLYLADEGSDNQKATIGDPNLLPQPWDPPTCRNPQLRAELWTWLEAVVVWFNHEYTWDPAAMIPTCWPQHPHLVWSTRSPSSLTNAAAPESPSTRTLSRNGTATAPRASANASKPDSRPTANRTTNPGPPAAVTPATPTSVPPTSDDACSRQTSQPSDRHSPHSPTGHDSPSSTPRRAR